MGMPVTVELADDFATRDMLDKAFEYFIHVDEVFSTYKDTSEISAINRGEVKKEQFSPEMEEVFRLSEETKQKTEGYFDIQRPDGTYDPSGLVKGWAIYNAAELLAGLGCQNFYVDAGGDIEVRGRKSVAESWTFGIKNPFNQNEIVKAVHLEDKGIATSGNYIRGQHIYNPKTGENAIEDIVSLTVIGDNVYEADRFATAAFAMGEKGIEFIARQKGCEGYMISSSGIATMTRGFGVYVAYQ